MASKLFDSYRSTAPKLRPPVTSDPISTLPPNSAAKLVEGLEERMAAVPATKTIPQPVTKPTLVPTKTSNNKGSLFAGMRLKPNIPEPDHDLCCAVALGFVEDSRVVPHLDKVQILNEKGEPLTQFLGWLKETDPLDAMTIGFLKTKQEASRLSAKLGTGIQQLGSGQYPLIKAAHTKVVQASIEYRQRGRSILQERGVFDKALEMGLVIHKR